MTPPFDIETHVRRHGAALRDLALALVGDANTADDAVQATWVAALQRPPRHEEALGGWFATLLRNVIGGWRRRERRRAAREEVAAAARGEVGEDHAVQVAREELVQRLMTALAALDAPFRDAIWQRYFEGKTPRAIAAASGVPVATVKSRLQRGLGMLRVRLGEDDRDGRGDWRSAFAVAFGLEKGTAVAASAAVAGGVLMATWMKVAGALAAAAVAVVLCWPGTVAPSTTAMTRDAADRPSLAVADLGVGRAAAPAAAASDAPRSEAPLAAPRDPKLATIRGRCVDEKGQPLAECAIHLDSSANASNAAKAWLRDHDEPKRLDMKTASASDGSFAMEFEASPAQLVMAGARRSDRARMYTAWFIVAAGEVVDLGDVVMTMGALVTGRAVDSDGKPCAGVFLSLGSTAAEGSKASDPRRWWPATSFSAECNDQGAFRCGEAVRDGTYALSIVQGGPHAEDTIVSPKSFEVRADRGPIDLVAVLAPPAASATITGAVVDETGRPVRGINVVWQRGEAMGGAATARDGTFVLRCTDAKPSGAVELLLQVGTIYELREPLRTEWGARDLTLQVVRRPTTALRVVDRDDRPVNDFSAALVSVAWGGGGFSSRRPVEGRVNLGVCEPGTSIALVEFPRASAMQPLVERVEVSPRGGDIVLRAGTQASRRVRVQRSDGAPVVGARVQVIEPMGSTFGTPGLAILDRGSWIHRSNAARMFVLEECTTDAAGTATIRGPADRVLALRVIDARSAPCEREGVRFDTAADLEITLNVGARLRGKVGPPEALAELRRLARADTGFEAGRRPSLSLWSQGRYAWPQRNAQDEVRRWELADDGTFDVDGAPAGAWSLVLSHWFVLDTVSGSRELEAGTATLCAGETTAVDVDIARILPGMLRAQVFRNGQPLAKQRLMLQWMDGRERSPEAREWTAIDTDADGRFEHRGRPGQYCVELNVGGTRLQSAPATIVRGTMVEHTFVLDTATLQLRLVDAAGKPVTAVTVYTEPGGGAGRTDDEGRAEIVCVPGECTVRVLPKRLQTPQAQAALREEARAKGVSNAFEAHWLRLPTATITAGQTTKLELTLPPEWEK